MITLTLANTKDQIVAAIEELRSIHVLEKPEGEAWLPSIQKRNLLAIYNELMTLDAMAKADDKRYEEVRAFAELTDAQQHASHSADLTGLSEAEKADITGDTFSAMSMAQTMRRAMEAQAEAAKHEDRPRGDGITDAPVTSEELAKVRAKIADVSDLLEAMKTASSTEKRRIRDQLRKRGHFISKKIEAQQADAADDR